MRSIHLLALPVLLLALSGCGKKGPLYLPQPPQPKTEKPALPAPAAAPAPTQEKQP